ncbi:amidohydrolase [Paludibacterium yongneupense]|uniref:amidohydrolase n=1 Tax=Paludibacterium yongneupense TaxID=400061 RepID=UPI000420E501|nr:amidohydrolase [Paludibacterium yongneupense]
MRPYDFFVQQHDALTVLRRALHRRPELGYREFETAATIAGELRELGIEHEVGVGRTGIVATVVGRHPGAGSVGLRADMDALPLHEADTVAHRSEYPGRMHACGHDGHTAMLLGVARYLAQHRDFSGVVRLVFQPGEEGYKGGLEMVEDGLFTRFPMNEIYALHNWPELSLGSVGVVSGPIMAAVDRVSIRLIGHGGHGGAGAHRAVDPIRAAGAVIQAVHSLISRETDPMQAAVLSLCGIAGGELDAFAAIPDQVTITGTLRTLDAATRETLVAALIRVCEHTAQAHGARAEVQCELLLPVTVNAEGPAEHARATVARVFGEATLAPAYGPSMGGEDFSFMLAACPGAYLHLGTRDDEHHCGLHNTSYDFNDRAIVQGATLLTELALGALARLNGQTSVPCSPPFERHVVANGSQA